MTRALVLGGGGPVGIGWENGLLAGFARSGVDLGQADFILGTSAGAFVGARLALGLDAATFADPPRGGGRGESRPAGPAPDLGRLVELMAEAQSGKRNPTEVRAEIGAFALAADTIGEEDFLASFGARFAAQEAWPQKDFACTAVDAVDGGFKLWTARSGVPLNRAVASSCSVPGIYPPVTIEGRRYIDGGMRSSTNADMAAGCDVVVVVAVRLAGPGDIAARVQAKLDEEVQTLQDGGATVVVIGPDEASAEAFGPNLMDASRVRGAVEAGLAQGKLQAAILKEIWG
jgi:NTE family protein